MFGDDELTVEEGDNVSVFEVEEIHETEERRGEGKEREYGREGPKGRGS